MDSKKAVAGKVLLVEDDSLLRRDLADILRLEGFKVTAVKTSLQGLEALSQEAPPGVIISDVRMSNLQEDPFVTVVRSTKMWRDIPFVFLTGTKLPEDAPKTPGEKREVFLKKPFDIQDLLTAVKRFLSSAPLAE
jgi:CheY-like chemotaxis protein